MKIVFLSLFLTATALGQDLETEHLKPEQRSQAQSEAGRAAAEAKKRALPGIKTGVTYEQLLADPDNVKLNYRYAAAQVKKGNLLGASAALERVLAVKPQEKKPRILYAVVLFRLGSLAEAEKEFSSLKAMDITAEMRARIDEYLRRIRRRLKKTQLRVLVGGGIDYDTNRNAGPSGGRRLFLDNPIILNSASTRKGDTGKIFLAQIGVDHDLGFQAGHRVYAQFSYYRAEQTTLPRLNLQNYSGKAGAVVRLPWFDFIPEFKVDHLRLAQTTYLRSRTGRLKFERRFAKKKYDLFAEAAHTDLKYNRTQVVPLGHERTGDRIEGGIGGGMRLFKNMKLSLDYHHVNVSAVENYNGYARETVSLRHYWMLGGGHFLLAKFTANFDQYKKPDIAISARTRRTRSLRARGTYGLPLAALSESLRGLVWTFTYEYYQAFSNIMNYSYTNNSISSLLTYRWDLGL